MWLCSIDLLVSDVELAGRTTGSFMLLLLQALL